MVEAAGTHEAESRVDVRLMTELVLERDAAIARSLTWQHRSQLAERQRDVAARRADSVAHLAAAAPAVADSATLYANAYGACSIALDAATLSCAQKDSALAGKELALQRSDSVVSVNLRAWQRAGSTLAIAVTAPRRADRCRVVGLLPCPSPQVAIGTAVLVHGFVEGWLRPPDMQIRW